MSPRLYISDKYVHSGSRKFMVSVTDEKGIIQPVALSLAYTVHFQVVFSYTARVNSMSDNVL